MDQSLEEQVAERMAKLPEDVRNAVTSADLGLSIRAIGTAHQLHIDQEDLLETAIYMAMLGFAPLDELPKAVEHDLNLPADKAALIVADVNTKILAPLRESIKKFGEARTTPAPVPTVPAPTQKAPINPALHAADVVLTEKTASIAPATPIYKADPYREPV